ncbi:MAG: phenylalanine--tRNA ligase subunit beta [Deltaproteobacteria bacterium]|nr:phenylalanine--tRNA ligase subunit beta [Deltaproteobacteria bacterium]
MEKLPSPKELADALTMAGVEVESITRTGAELNNVITARILSCAPHPNADRLQLCEVATDSQKYSIVCGARNMKAGDRVALALPGAKLPNGVIIKKSKIRGVESEGMMCSEVEMGIKETSEGIMILPEDTPLGADINKVLGPPDFLLEVGITPNRADLLSIRGLAREISAVLGLGFKDKSIEPVEGETDAADIASVNIEVGAPCRRYCARVIENVSIAPSPDDIRKKLEAHGVRAINNVVDVTNLVLLELGQPLHAFDLDRLSDRTIDVRLAAEGETIETIDNKVRKLDPAMLVIADSKAPVALAGVMGGKFSEVSDSTRNILLESAWFEPSSVRRTSRKTGLSSDSSYRFERGVDIKGVRNAIDVAAALINRLAGGKTAKGVIDIYPEEMKQPEISFRVKRCEDLLGISVGVDTVKNIFQRLGVEITEKDGAIKATPPTYRVDLKNEADLVEEVARLSGYGNIPTVMPVAALTPGKPGRHTRIKKTVAEVLTNEGFCEAINYSFISRELFGLTGPVDKKGVTILNPLTEEQVIMRDSLIPSLLDTLRRNLAKKNEEVRIFEFAPAFIAGEDKLPKEEWKVAGVMYGLRFEESWCYPKEGFDFFDVKGVVETVFEGLGANFDLKAMSDAGQKTFHPGKSAVITVNGKVAGAFGEIHPELKMKLDLKRPAYLFEIDVDAVTEAGERKRKYSPLPRFPESTRDIAFIVDESVPYKDIIGAIKMLDAKLIERVELFDVYYAGNIPPGKRSMALRIVYRSMERTLTAEEVEEMHSRVAGVLSSMFAAEVRGEAPTVQ